MDGLIRSDRRRRLPPAGALVVLLLALLASCGGEQSRNSGTGGDPRRGVELIRQHGCGACHRIPGVTGAVGEVGPGLERIAKRAYLGGVAPNHYDNMVRWLLAPRALAPGSAMPDVGLDEAGARDVAAYLYTLK